jgi:hypothetical protein
VDETIKVVVMALLRQSSPHVGQEIRAALGTQVPDEVNQAIEDAMKNYWAEPETTTE